MTKKEVKHKKGAKIKDIIRLFFKYDIDAIPVVDNKNNFKGLIFKKNIIEYSGEVAFIEKSFSTVSDKFLFFPEESEFLQFISKLNDSIEFPVINLKGILLYLWRKKDLLNLYYSITRDTIKSSRESTGIDFEKIVNILPINFIIVNSKNKIIFASKAFLENLDFKKEILINQSVLKIFPRLTIIRTKNSLYPKVHKIKYQHQDWYYTILNLESTGTMKGYYVYIFSTTRYMLSSERDELKVKEEPLLTKEHKSLNEIIELQEKEMIQKVLEENEWNISQAARILKIPRQTLQYKISKYKIC